MAQKYSGFTLVELTIVMVIMGLLIAGIVSGKNVYHAAHLRATMTDIENYRLAIRNFVLQYGDLPGDFNQAGRVWPDKVVNNGNRNGRIEAEESFGAWQQLELAGMISGHYSGSGTDVVIGSNIPASRYANGSGYYLSWVVGPGGWKDVYGQLWEGNYLLFGKEGSGSSALLTGSVLLPEDAYVLDSKMDNGLPGSGVILSASGDGGNGCAVGDTYDMTISIPACVLYIRLQD